MMRIEFTKPTKRLALERSGMLCEGIGRQYGLDHGKRCNAPLGYGVDFDHVIADAIGGDNSLDNCAAVCRDCHRFKTAKFDTPRAAKTKRQSDKHLGITKPKYKWPKRKFGS
jgi:5-methylcytosine-specific restriction endonuclease McrA